MGKIKLVAVSGNLAKPSRSASLVAEVTAAIARRLAVESRTVDLADVAGLVGPLVSRKDLPDAVEQIFRMIETADLLVVGSPVYKASYTGLFKHLFDFVDPEALIGIPVVLTATGGSDRHSLVFDHQFRPLFAFFGALTLPTAIYAKDGDFDNYRLSNPQIANRIEQAAQEAGRVLARDEFLSAKVRVAAE